jgi:hypothetical protein
MRSGGWAARVGAVAVVTAATWGMAAPTALASGPAAPTGSSTYARPRVLCTITDRRLPAISGAVGTRDGLLVANDQGAEVFTLDDDCSVSGAVRWTATAADDATPFQARDIEDLAVGPDGTEWLVDSGGSRIQRHDVSLLGIAPDGTGTELVFAYPTGATHDVEAALVTEDLQLVLLAKERGRSTVFTARMPAPDAQADVTGPVALTRVGVLDVEAWADPGLGDAGLFLTGAALSPDGRHVAVRTAAEIFEWVIDGTGPAAELVDEEPTTVASVRGRPGRAITYGPDGSSLLALSEQLPAPVLVVDIERAAGSGGAPAIGVPRWGYGLLGGAGGALLLVLVVALWRRRTTSPDPGPGPHRAPGAAPEQAPEQELVP